MTYEQEVEKLTEILRDIGCNEAKQKAESILAGRNIPEEPEEKEIEFIWLYDKIDTLKEHRWWVWTCDVEFKDGTIRPASIQSDGHMHAYETIEYED